MDGAKHRTTWIDELLQILINGSHSMMSFFIILREGAKLTKGVRVSIQSCRRPCAVRPDGRPRAEPSLAHSRLIRTGAVSCKVLRLARWHRSGRNAGLRQGRAGQPSSAQGSARGSRSRRSALHSAPVLVSSRFSAPFFRMSPRPVGIAVRSSEPAMFASSRGRTRGTRCRLREHRLYQHLRSAITAGGPSCGRASRKPDSRRRARYAGSRRRTPETLDPCIN
jgi:hypothetical protein